MTTVAYAKISPKLVNPRDIAGNAEEEEEEEEQEEQEEQEEEQEEVSMLSWTLKLFGIYQSPVVLL